MNQELMKWGIGGMVIIAVFWKFIPSLFEFLYKFKGSNGGGQQIQINALREDFMVMKADIKGIETHVSNMGETLSANTAILTRVEAKVHE